MHLTMHSFENYTYKDRQRDFVEKREFYDYYPEEKPFFYNLDYGDENGGGWEGASTNYTREYVILGNFSGNSSSDPLGPESVNNWWALVALLLVLCTAAGNVLVCLAIYLERRLQNVTNYFLMSLAITDLLVAVLVMPLGILTLVRAGVKVILLYQRSWGGCGLGTSGKTRRVARGKKSRLADGQSPSWSRERFKIKALRFVRPELTASERPLMP